jgi:hypothetical protein
MDQLDGDSKLQRKTKSIHTKFSIPLCCFGANSQFDAEFNLTTNESTEENVDAAQTCADAGGVEAKSKQCKGAELTATTEAAANRISKAPELAAPDNTITTTTTPCAEAAESCGSL